jgi:hypothetical protein
MIVTVRPSLIVVVAVTNAIGNFIRSRDDDASAH